MSFSTDNDNFSLFKRNFKTNNILQLGGTRTNTINNLVTRDMLLNKFLEYYDNKYYVSKKKRTEAIIKDMQSLKKEAFRIYIDDNGNALDDTDNIMRIKDFMDGNIEKYDIVAKNPELQHLGIDGFNEGYEFNMGEILKRDDFRDINIISKGIMKTNDGKSYQEVFRKKYNDRAKKGFICKDGRTVAKLHHCKLPNLIPLPDIKGMVSVSQSSQNSSPKTTKQSSQHSSRHSSQHSSRHGSQHSSRHGSQHSSRHGSQHSSRHGSQHSSRHGSQHSSRHGSQHSSRHGSQHSSRHSTPVGSRHSTPVGSRHSTPVGSRRPSHNSSVHSSPLISMSSGYDSPADSVISNNHGGKNRSNRSTPIDDLEKFDINIFMDNNDIDLILDNRDISFVNNGNISPISNIY